MEKRVVSIIVPVYNCEGFLPECMQSLLNQTYNNIEIILVDDGSKDSSGGMCDQFAQNHDNVVVIHQVNSGAAKARQVGVSNSTGDYIMFVDSDDQIEENYIETFISIEGKYHCDIVIGGYKYFKNGKKNECKPFFPEGEYSKIDLENTIYPQMLSATPFHTSGIFPTMWGKLYKASIVKNNLKALDSGIYWGEDGCFVYSVLPDCKSIYITENTGYIYQYNECSVTNNFKPELLDDNIKLKAFYENLSIEKNINISSQLDEYMAHVCAGTVITALLSKNSVSNRELKKYIKTVYPVNIHANPNFKKTSFKNKLKFLLIKNRSINVLRKILMWYHNVRN